MEIDGFIPIDKAVKWLQNKVYDSFDSMCLDFSTKDECIETFINDMKDPDYGKTSRDWYDDEWWTVIFNRIGWVLKIVKFDEFVLL